MRTLTDEDIQAICDELEKRLVKLGLVVKPKEPTQPEKDGGLVRYKGEMVTASEAAASMLHKVRELKKIHLTHYSLYETAKLLGTTAKEMNKQKKAGIAWPFPEHRFFNRSYFKKTDVDNYLKKQGSKR